MESKKLGNVLVKEICDKAGLPLSIINPSFIYGARDMLKPVRKGNVKAALGQLPCFTYGSVDVVAVEDVVANMIECMSSIEAFEEFNVTGSPLSIRTMLEAISGFAGARMPRFGIPNSFLRFFARLLIRLNPKWAIYAEGCIVPTLHMRCTPQQLTPSTTSALDAIRNSVKWFVAQRKSM